MLLAEDGAEEGGGVTLRGVASGVGGGGGRKGVGSVGLEFAERVPDVESEPDGLCGERNAVRGGGERRW
jgi:hypothetical protein